MMRRVQGEGSVYFAADGRWHASVSLGRDAGGRRRRRHVQAASQREVVRKLESLRRSKEPSETLTMGEWSRSWLGLISRTCKPSTARSYRTHLRYLSVLDGLALRELTPEHLEDIYVGLSGRGLSAATVVSAHRSIRSCLAEGVRRGYLDRNPAMLARPPRAEGREVQPLSVEEVRAVLAAAAGHPNAARWQIALALGLRQGEALGLRWDDIDLEGGMIHVRRALQRGTWRHGCNRVAVCTDMARHCPDRYGGGLIVVTPKSLTSRRTVGIPPPLVDALRDHRRIQDRQRDAAARQDASEVGVSAAGDQGWVFTTAGGGPIDPHRDWRAWHELLADAGVRRARLHDARHTAATLLLQVGTDTRTVTELLGWSQPMMIMRYQHVIDQQRRDAARRLGSLVWGQYGALERGQGSACYRSHSTIDIDVV